MYTTGRNKLKLALTGPPASPKLYSALKLAFGLCGNWNRIIVVGASKKDTACQHLGSFSTLSIPPDASPQRYSDLLNLCSACKDVIIFSSLSDEWTHGVTAHLEASYYEEVLNAHRTFFTAIRHSPVHVLCCIDTKRTLEYKESKPWWHLYREVIQQEGIEHYFTTVLSQDKKGQATAAKDLTQMLPQETSFAITEQVGALLQDWCSDGQPLVSIEMQQRIDECYSLSELYQLLFDLEIEDVELISAFTKRRLELDHILQDGKMEIIKGGRV